MKTKQIRLTHSVRISRWVGVGAVIITAFAFVAALFTGMKAQSLARVTPHSHAQYYAANVDLSSAFRAHH